MPRQVFAVLMLLLASCGDAKRSYAMKDKRAAKEPHAPLAGGDERAAEKGAAQRPEKAQRKIIYTGRMRLQVENYPATLAKLQEMLQDSKGYLTTMRELGSPGSPRHAQWTVRVPASEAAWFRGEVAKLGEVLLNELTSQDVTGQYFDTQAEAANKEAEEKALRELYDKIKAAKPQDLVGVTQALSRVRGEINSRKSQLKVWDELTTYTTLTLEIDERTRYSAPESPPLSTRMGRAISDSWSNLVAVCQGLLVGLAGALPWAAGLAIIAVPVVLVVRARRRVAPPPPPPPPGTLPILDDKNSSPETLPPS